MAGLTFLSEILGWVGHGQESVDAFFVRVAQGNAWQVMQPCSCQSACMTYAQYMYLVSQRQV